MKSKLQKLNDIDLIALSLRILIIILTLLIIKNIIDIFSYFDNILNSILKILIEI